MAEAVTMPRQGQSVETCVITQWLKKKGDKITVGEMLFSYETDKAAFDEEASTSGTLLEILYEEGDEVPVLQTVAIIGEPGEDISELTGKSQIGEESKESKPKMAAPTPPEEESVIPETNKKEAAQKIRISPRARKMASSLGVNISLISGSGPNGRIIADDISSAAKLSENKIDIPSPPPLDHKKQKDTTASGAYTDEPLTNIRKIIASSMISSLQNSAQLTHHIHADARSILKLRKDIKEGSEDRLPVTTTLNDMVCFGIVQALKETPEINAHFLGDRIRSFSGVHLGMAVDTPRGLMVPVLRNADRLTLGGLGLSLRELAESCKNGSIDPDLLQPDAGSFTISNLGAFGIEMFTPVLNLPQCGIIGVNTISYQAADLGDGNIGFIPHIGISLTYDHRAIDGAPASRFLQKAAQYISTFDPKL